jgi:ring-1,2-phenylacetyl-CoA epoxidase subunit PaaE
VSKFHELRIASVTPDTRDAIVVTLEPPPGQADAFRFIQGQHLTLRGQLDGEELRRSYSICSAAHEQELKIVIKRVADGRFSSWAHERLQVGQSVECMEPAGHFHVPLLPDQARHHVAFAAGSGITPIISLIKTTLHAEPLSRFSLIYGNRASSSVILREELEDLKDQFLSRFNLVFILSREQLDIDLFCGRIDREKCDRLLESWLDASEIDMAYICGPRSMMEAVSASLQGHGLDKSQIKMELFDAGLPLAPRTRRSAVVEKDQHCQVTIIQDGRTRQLDIGKTQMTLLDAALEQGVELPYACKGGVCSTCRCKLVRGEVDMNAAFALEDYEIARGFILTCQSFPLSDELVLDFDQET